MTLAPYMKLADLASAATEFNGQTSAQALIDFGYPPLFAWVHVHKIDVVEMACNLGFENRFPMLQPMAVMDEFLRGIYMPDAATLLEMCEHIGISPEQLISQKARSTVHPHIIEAGVLKARQIVAHGAPLPKPLATLLQRQVLFSQQAGNLKLTAKHSTNAEIFHNLEYGEVARRVQKNLIRALEAECLTHATLMDVIYNLVYQQEQLLADRASEAGSHRRTFHTEREQCRKIYDLTAQQLARTQGTGALQQACDALAKKMGIFDAARALREDAERYLPLRPNWRNMGAVLLPDGRYVVNGEKILDAMCNAIIGIVAKHNSWERWSRKANETDTELKNFQQWVRSPRTQVYLVATASRALINRYLTPEMLGMKSNLPVVQKSHLPGPRNDQPH